MLEVIRRWWHLTKVKCHHLLITSSYFSTFSIQASHPCWTGTTKYLSDCVSTVSALGGRYRLRSTGSADYVLPRTRTKFGERGFSYCGPAAWNTLPSDLHDIKDTDTFRKRLKCVLFDRAYHWLLLALLDVSYSGALQILHWLIWMAWSSNFIFSLEIRV